MSRILFTLFLIYYMYESPNFLRAARARSLGMHRSPMMLTTQVKKRKRECRWNTEIEMPFPGCCIYEKYCNAASDVNDHTVSRMLHISVQVGRYPVHTGSPRTDDVDFIHDASVLRWKAHSSDCARVRMGQQKPCQCKK
jgi:hypothetical protein